MQNIDKHFYQVLIFLFYFINGPFIFYQSDNNTIFPVIFTSHIEGGSHGKTKAKWIKKHYPFQNGIVYTREKNVLCGSVVGHVDDRLSHLKGFEVTKRYLFNTKYVQDVECLVMETIYGWDSAGSSFVNDLIKMWR